MLSKKTYARLKSALTRKALADEFQALLISPAPASEKLKAQIKNMMCNKAASDEVIAALETAGLQSLSGPGHPNAARRLLDALCSKDAYSEIKALL